MQYKGIEESILKILDNLASELGISKDSEVVTKCLFSVKEERFSNKFYQGSKALFSNYCDRGLHGLKAFFSSSFAEYLLR
jgi:hypothetical protein